MSWKAATVENLRDDGKYDISFEDKKKTFSAGVKDVIPYEEFRTGEKIFAKWFKDGFPLSSAGDNQKRITKLSSGTLQIANLQSSDSGKEGLVGAGEKTAVSHL